MVNVAPTPAVIAPWFKLVAAFLACISNGLFRIEDSLLLCFQAIYYGGRYMSVNVRYTATCQTCQHQVTVVCHHGVTGERSLIVGLRSQK
jgi:hypothetical protein